MRLSPSSFGIQGRGFVVVENPALRQQLLPYAWNQKQVVDASHLLVLCRRTDVNTDFIRHYIQITAQNRGVSIDTLDGFSSMLL